MILDSTWWTDDLIVHAEILHAVMTPQPQLAPGASQCMFSFPLGTICSMYALMLLSLFKWMKCSTPAFNSFHMGMFQFCGLLESDKKKKVSLFNTAEWTLVSFNTILDMSHAVNCWSLIGLC